MSVYSSTTTSITLNSNKIQNGDILVPANPGPPAKWPLKRKEKIREAKIHFWISKVCKVHGM